MDAFSSSSSSRPLGSWAHQPLQVESSARAHQCRALFAYTAKAQRNSCFISATICEKQGVVLLISSLRSRKSWPKSAHWSQQCQHNFPSDTAPVCLCVSTCLRRGHVGARMEFMLHAESLTLTLLGLLVKELSQSTYCQVEIASWAAKTPQVDRNWPAVGEDAHPSVGWDSPSAVGHQWPNDISGLKENLFGP